MRSALQPCILIVAIGVSISLGFVHTVRARMCQYHMLKQVEGCPRTWAERLWVPPLGAPSDQPHLAVRSSSLSCRLSDKDSCGGKFELFLERCFYQPGQYASEEDFSALSERLSKVEKVRAASALAESATCMPSCPAIILITVELHHTWPTPGGMSMLALIQEQANAPPSSTTLGSRQPPVPEKGVCMALDAVRVCACRTRTRV